MLVAMLVAASLSADTNAPPIEEYVLGMTLVERTDRRIVPIKLEGGTVEVSEISGGTIGGQSVVQHPPKLQTVDFDENRWPKMLPAFGVVVLDAEEDAPLTRGDVIFAVGAIRVGTPPAVASALANPGTYSVQFQRYHIQTKRWVSKTVKIVVPE